MPSMIQLANERISIAQACRWAQVDIPDGFGNRKTRCPFGITHPDGGVEAALRLYEDTNGAHCFACARSWTPVSLMAEFWDCDRATAADKMCQLAGITPPTYRDQWDELHRPPVPDRAALAEALKIWCRKIRGPSWEREQFEPRFAQPLGACLYLLPFVSTERESAIWFDGCQSVMETILRGEDG